MLAKNSKEQNFEKIGTANKGREGIREKCQSVKCALSAKRFTSYKW